MHDYTPELLIRSAARHDHLCPRQVLGVRMGLAGMRALDVEPPISKPTALVIVETDGCFVDGIEVATGATVGHRTLRINDLGKIAATFVDARAARSIRLSARHDARLCALQYAPSESDRYAAQLEGYRVMPVEELFRSQWVELEPSLHELLSRPDVRVKCDICGEEVFNERELTIGGAVVCRACAGEGYYTESPKAVQACSMNADAFKSVPGEANESAAKTVSAVR